jgi:hypothetical protein
MRKATSRCRYLPLYRVILCCSKTKMWKQNLISSSNLIFQTQNLAETKFTGPNPNLDGKCIVSDGDRHRRCRYDGLGIREAIGKVNFTAVKQVGTCSTEQLDA